MVHSSVHASRHFINVALVYNSVGAVLVYEARGVSGTYRPSARLFNTRPRDNGIYFRVRLLFISRRSVITLA